jgi:hypothetical protein
MSDRTPGSLDHSEQREVALSLWDNEGGAGPRDAKTDLRALEVQQPPLVSTNSELEQLRIRVIALENLMIALFADAPDWQLSHAREMAAYISPRPRFTRHPVTIQAAAHMIDLVQRAARFRLSKHRDGAVV